MTSENFDVIVIGGSYSGLAAGMSLGRALRRVLIIDSGKPCNIQTPHSHNFLTQDGKTPKEISSSAKAQVEKYDTVKFYSGLATSGARTDTGFAITTQSGDTFTARKLIFATGIKDIMPPIPGLPECWGKTVIHCPYCHGYEVRKEKTGILGNGDYGFDFAKMISNWTDNLTLFTNGKSTLTLEQTEKIRKHNINIIENEIENIEHDKGNIQKIKFKDNSSIGLKALYLKPAFEQNSHIPADLGCGLTEQGYLQVDMFQKTSLYGVYACGDNTTFIRSVANAVAAGTLSGSMVNREMVDEAF